MPSKARYKGAQAGFVTASNVRAMFTSAKGEEGAIRLFELIVPLLRPSEEFGGLAIAEVSIGRIAEHCTNGDKGNASKLVSRIIERGGLVRLRESSGRGNPAIYALGCIEHTATTQPNNGCIERTGTIQPLDEKGCIEGKKRLYSATLPSGLLTTNQNTIQKEKDTPAHDAAGRAFIICPICRHHAEIVSESKTHREIRCTNPECERFTGENGFYTFNVKKAG